MIIKCPQFEVLVFDLSFNFGKLFFFSNMFHALINKQLIGPDQKQGLQIEGILLSFLQSFYKIVRYFQK
jgi:hypothetical protein